MAPIFELYVAIIGLLLLFAVVKTLPVLRGIFEDGIERQRSRRASENERGTDDRR